MKESLCYVARDPLAELQRPESELLRRYTMPDGRVLELGRERVLAPELLMAPEKGGEGEAGQGLPRLILEAALKCPIDARLPLLQNILLVGGGTLLPGLPARLEDEIWALMQAEKGMRGARRTHVRVKAPPKYAFPLPPLPSSPL